MLEGYNPTLTAPRGIEPLLEDPNSSVLPLDDRASFRHNYIILKFSNSFSQRIEFHHLSNEDVYVSLGIIPLSIVAIFIFLHSFLVTRKNSSSVKHHHFGLVSFKRHDCYELSIFCFIDPSLFKSKVSRLFNVVLQSHSFTPNSCYIHYTEKVQRMEKDSS